MNRRQRVLAVQDHKEPDRVLLDFTGRRTTVMGHNLSSVRGCQ